MLGDFYRARWKVFFNALEEGMTNTSAEWFKCEESWSRSKTITKVAEEDAIGAWEELFNKCFTK